MGDLEERCQKKKKNSDTDIRKRWDREYDLDTSQRSRFHTQMGLGLWPAMMQHALLWTAESSRPWNAPGYIY